MSRELEIAENLAALHLEIDQAARQAGRDPEEIQLICVSKNFPLSDILLAYKLGERNFGENRVQELAEKVSALGDLIAAGQLEPSTIDPDRLSLTGLKWHMIGSLQRNKAKEAVELADMIHSAHSEVLLRRLNLMGQRREKSVEILMQVNIAEEASKQGFSPDEAECLLEDVDWQRQYPWLQLSGLMVIAPHFTDPDDCLPVFTQAQRLFDRMKQGFGDPIYILSMGMSNDFRQAIRCGATHLRIGSRIFGNRRY